MVGTELAYVRAQLAPLKPAERAEVAEVLKLNVKTLNRLASRVTKYGRTDTVGKLSMYFRARDSKRRA